MFGCLNCSQEKKDFKLKKNDLPELESSLNKLDDKKIIKLYFELNLEDKQILLNYLQIHKPTIIDRLNEIINSPDMQNAWHNIAMTNPLYAAPIGVLDTVQALTGRSDSAHYNPYVLDPLYVRAHENNTNSGGKSRRHRRSRRLSNKKSRKGRKSRKSHRRLSS